FAAQREAFVAAVGRAPQFVDGHQHVHHLPVVRDVVLRGIAADATPVRNTGRVVGPGFAVKRALIAGTGGRTLARELAQRGIPHNRVLLGVYDFVPGGYRGFMQAWLAAAPANGGLLFCHPGDADRSGVPDAIAAARIAEADHLGSDAFADDLAAANVQLGRAWARLT
ncbi:MAG TPA: ChbG/HpnK family deacetylase, partial [Albitalea sp.]|nr:ChbG/HpnK family deacetylase [Albitalea sp.]